MYGVTNKEGPNADLPLAGVRVKAKGIQLVEATKTKYFLRLAGQSPQPIVHVTINKDDSFSKQLVQQVATSEARAEIYKQLGVELTTTEGAEGETSSEMMDETILEELGPRATRLLGVAIKEEVVDEEYIPYKTRKMTKVLTGKPIQTKKTIHEKAELEPAEVVDLCSSDEEMGDVSGVSTTAVKQEEEEDNEDDDDDDDAKCTGESSGDSSDDKFGIAGLKQIYEERFEGDKEQKMDTTEETKGLRQTGKAGAKSTIKIKKSEKPRVAAGIPLYEPPMMR